MVAFLGRGQESFRKIVERLGGDAINADPAFLLPPRELAPCAMEFAVRRQDLELPGLARRRGHQANEEVVGVR